VRQAQADRLSGQLRALRLARASAPAASAAAQPWSQACEVRSPASKVAASAAAAAGATLRSAAEHLEGSRGGASASKHILAMITSLQSHLDTSSS
jgi:hypothetical protein